MGNNAHGTAIFAPSGVAIWNSPTIDAARGLMYVGTGDNYSSPAQATSDAVVAFDLNSGAIRWVRQTTAHDAWNVACFAFIEDQANCPAEGGPDVDFAAPPVHVNVQGREILIAAQKSGDVYGIDPDTTEIVWHRKVGRGGIQGGINFGLAAEGSTVFVPVSDFDDDVLPVADARPGLFALNAFTGEFVWSHRAADRCGDRKDCDPGISAPVTAIPGVVFAGHTDAWIRAYASDTGAELWSYDSYQEVTTVSGERARGGTISGGGGPIIDDGKLYVVSGYGIYFHMPGNLLMVFEAAN